MDNRKAFVFAIIAIFFSLTALGVSDSITSTGNNTTGITNHANLTNLDYASANHTGFTSQSVIPSCAHISGHTATINKLSNTSFECAYIVVPDYTEFAFLTDIDNLNNIKVNKSGDTMTGKLNISITNGTFSGFTMLGSAGTPFTTYHENSTMRSELTLAGIQIWKVKSTVVDPVGYIVYSTPNDKPGIVLYNGSLSRRINLMARDTGFMINAATTAGFKSTGLLIDTDDNITVSGLVGTGNVYACINANGKLYRGSPGC